MAAVGGVELLVAQKIGIGLRTDYHNPMGKLDDAKRAAAEAAQRRAERREPSPPEAAVDPWAGHPGYEREDEYEAAPVVGRVIGKPLHPRVAAAIAKTREPVKRGRPVSGDDPRLPLTLKLTAGERAELVLAADRAGDEPVSAWVRRIALEAAREAGDK